MQAQSVEQTMAMPFYPRSVCTSTASSFICGGAHWWGAAGRLCKCALLVRQAMQHHMLGGWCLLRCCGVLDRIVDPHICMCTHTHPTCTDAQKCALAPAAARAGP